VPQAYGKIMGAELPHVPGGTDVVLYPASARASGDLQQSLEASGFKVNCIRTYDTVGVKSADAAVLQEVGGRVGVRRARPGFWGPALRDQT
jgi:uroporphyrinogen-III synthase